jgi:hypothetical protein
MTETREQSQSSASLYERLRDGLEGEGGISWRDGDRWTSYLREKFETLRADEKLSEEGKYEAAEKYLAKTRPRIEQAYEAARSHLEAEAKRKRGASIPLPGGGNLSTIKVKDSSEVLAIQGEAQAVISRIERVRDRMPKGMRGDPAMDVLREVYASAMDDGGVEGMTRARGCLKAAEQLGVPQDELVAPFREQRHYEAADEAYQLENLRRSVPSGKSVPANPFTPKPKRSGGDFHSGRAKALFKDASAQATPRPIAHERPGPFGSSKRRRKPLWK